MRIASRAVGLGVGLAVCLTVLSARAATVDLTEARTAPGSDQATLYLVNSLSVAVGGVQLVVTGAAGFSFNFAGSNLSSLDSSYEVQPIPGLDLLNALAPADVALAGPGQSVLLGTFSLPSGASPLPDLIPLDTVTGVPSTILDVVGNPFSATQYETIECAPDFGNCPITLRVTVAPEPSGLALGLAAFALFAVIWRREERSP
ncbi:MAG TPA: hypothetical protein VMR31_10835 [Myxococcota bacterium]|nr:hypothetical protein [Myxococcota bacterium]